MRSVPGNSASGGIGATPGDAGFRRITLIRRLVDATSTRETMCGANSDDIGRRNWVTSPSRAATCRSGQATNCGRYQLNARIDTDRWPSLIGSRKSSAAVAVRGGRRFAASDERGPPVIVDTGVQLVSAAIGGLP